MSVDYCEKYKVLKRKLKILVYEHEALSHELDKSHRKLLKVARDNSFLLDRLLQYEPVVFDSPTDSDATLSSDSETEEPPPKKKANLATAVKNDTNLPEKNIQVTDQKRQPSVTKENQSPVCSQEEIINVDLNQDQLSAEGNQSTVLKEDVLPDNVMVNGHLST